MEHIILNHWHDKKKSLGFNDIRHHPHLRQSFTFVINLSVARSCHEKHQNSKKYLNVDKKEIKLPPNLKKRYY